MAVFRLHHQVVTPQQEGQFERQRHTGKLRAKGRGLSTKRAKDRAIAHQRRSDKPAHGNALGHGNKKNYLSPNGALQKVRLVIARAIAPLW
jgi:hypothetical protein